MESVKLVLIRSFLNKNTRHRAGIFSCETVLLVSSIDPKYFVVSIDC